jgi:hypothetical protein
VIVYSLQMLDSPIQESCVDVVVLRQFVSEWLRATVIVSSMQMLRPKGEKDFF